MTRMTIRPTQSRIVLSVPEKYIGKKIEVLMFDMDEVNLESTAESPN